MSDVWRRCNICKKEIPFGGTCYVCSVSTCNQKRTGLVFCSVECWDAHLPDARHREGAGAVQERAPSRAEASGTPPAPVRRRVEAPPAAAPAPPGPSLPRGAQDDTAQDADILVVASRVKKYIREASGMNTSASTLEALTRCVIALCDAGIQNARSDERKTVMGRDVPRVRLPQDDV